MSITRDDKCLEEGTRQSPHVIYIIVIEGTRTLVSFWLIHSFLTRILGLGGVCNTEYSSCSTGKT